MTKEEYFSDKNIESRRNYMMLVSEKYMRDFHRAMLMYLDMEFYEAKRDYDNFKNNLNGKRS